MSVKIHFTHQLIVLFVSLVAAAGIGFLLNQFLQGPRLGAHYDFLLKFHEPPPVSGEILIINTQEYIENNDIFSVLLALTELDAEALVMTGKLSSLSSPVTVTESEVRNRFFDEYEVIGSNIRNLFEAIRMGFVSPLNAPEYVEKLVELTDLGKDRLLRALIDRDEDFLLSIAVFGNYIEVEPTQKTDRDGKLRRVQPVDMESFDEHPVFSYLKNRYVFSQIETIEESKILWLKTSYSNDEEGADIPLDINANIITPYNLDFRNIDLSLFKEYEEAERALKKILEEADVRGLFSMTLPERSPLFLGDYAQMAREDMLNSPTQENIQNWKNARFEYFKSLNEYLYGQAETLLVRGYEDVILDEEASLSEEGLAALAGMRDGLTQFFVFMREEYETLAAIRAKLAEELTASFCIMGPAANTEYSALLANALITKSHIKPVNTEYVLICSAIAVFVSLVLVFYLRPLILLPVGFVINIITAGFFGGLFILYSMWIDPLISFGAGFAGVIVIFLCKCIIIRNRTIIFRTAYGPYVSQKILKRIIVEGKLAPGQIIQTRAAIIAIRNVNLLLKEDKEMPQQAGKLKKAFYNTVKELVFNSGGIIAGFEGDTILACFGSPLDNSINPVNKACTFTKELLSNDKITWRFGIDSGLCTFYWSQETGFAVHGRAAVRARLLASRTIRLKVRALITENVRDKENLNLDKIDSLFNNEPIYELKKYKNT